MEHVELLGCILPSIQHNRLLTARVVRQEFGNIVHLAMKDHPAILLGVMLCDLLLSQCHRRSGSGGRSSGLDRGRSSGSRGRGGCCCDRGWCSRSYRRLTTTESDVHRETIRWGWLHSDLHLGVEMLVDDPNTVQCSSLGIAHGFQACGQQMLRSGGASHTSVNDAIQQRVVTEAVASMDASHDLTSSEETRNRCTIGKHS